MRKVLSRVISIVCAILVTPIIAPQLLAFPHSTTVGEHVVYSELPMSARTARLVQRADGLVARSPLGGAARKDQAIFLTNGGWRWTWLATSSGDAFALSRPLIETIVVNRSDQSRDVVTSSARIASERSLHGVIAHELAHETIRSHFGVLADLRYSAKLREGYCDYVAGGGSLSDAEAQQLLASGTHIPALTYWQGRKKVEKHLPRVGSVDALFANWRD